MRTVGALVIGMFAGLLVGVLLTEVVARLTNPEDNLGIALALGLAPPMLAAAGAVAGVVIERRSGGRAR
jgi:hypothetical protein